MRMFGRLSTSDRPPRWKRRSDDDFSAEIQAHLALGAERLVDAGMRPEEARLAAGAVSAT